MKNYAWEEEIPSREEMEYLYELYGASSEEELAEILEDCYGNIDD